jgi:hypothetical protein
MREFSYDALLDDYLFMQDVTRGIPDNSFPYLTPTECDDERSDLLEELRRDFAFKLLTRLEADIRQDFLLSIKRRLRDGVSKAYRDLCRVYRRETRQLSRQATLACSKISLDRIFDELREHFVATDEQFRRVCSATKGYFAFRNWYAHGRTRTPPLIPDPEDVFSAYQHFQSTVFDTCLKYSRSGW